MRNYKSQSPRSQHYSLPKFRDRFNQLTTLHQKGLKFPPNITLTKCKRKKLIMKFQQIENKRQKQYQFMRNSQERMQRLHSKCNQSSASLLNISKRKKKVLMKFPTVNLNIKEKYQGKQPKNIGPNLNFQLQLCSTLCLDSVFPILRISSCLVMVNRTFYLYGGQYRRRESRNQKIKNQSQGYLLFHRYDEEQRKWCRQGPKNNIPEQGRNPCYHTCESYGKNYLIFSGGLTPSPNPNHLTFNPFISFYNTDTQEFTNLRSNIEVRSHATHVYNNILIIHGGINPEGEYRKTLNIINMNSLINSSLLMVGLDSGIGAAHHKIVSTYEIEVNLRLQLGSYDGLMMFGGENADGLLDNNVRILKLYPNFPEGENIRLKKWEVMGISGKKPEPRTQHSLNILTKKAYLVLMGGKNQKDFFLDDIWVLDLLQLRWIQTKVSPKSGLDGGLAMHASIVDGSRIYIYGGVRKQPERHDFWFLETESYQDKWKQRKGFSKKTIKAKISSSIGINSEKDVGSLFYECKD